MANSNNWLALDWPPVFWWLVGLLFCGIALATVHIFLGPGDGGDDPFM